MSAETPAPAPVGGPAPAAAPTDLPDDPRQPAAARALSAPIGRIVAVNGSQAVALLDDTGPSGKADATRPEMGTLIKIDLPNAIVMGLVSALSVPAPAPQRGGREIRVVELELVGELARSDDGGFGDFRRGLTAYPGLGDPIHLASRDELEAAYSYQAHDGIPIGHILQDKTIPSMIRIDDLLGKHFAILGTTGTGKSCTVALILRGIIEKSPNAHIVLLDPHSEYAPSFGASAEVITLNTLNLPFWLLTFEEILEIFVGDQTGRDRDVEILSELIPMAKARYAASAGRGERAPLLARSIQEAGSYTVDTPAPYRISDLIALIQENIGKLDHQGALAPFKRLKSRVEQFSRDPRYGFMFGNLTVQDTMVDVLSQVFRIPVNGKPITIIDLAGLPSEVVNVTVSVLSRMTFDFGLWSDGKVPITLICEEAHRYVPADSSLGFEPTTRAISRIAKEGRKYGISLGVISQRPAELAPTILSQCNTIFAMRLSNDLDQSILRAAISDAASSLLEFLPSMGNREAIAFGEGVALPARIRLARLPDSALPQSRTREFSIDWTEEVGDKKYLEEIVGRWRARTRAGEAAVSEANMLAPEPAPAAQTDQPEGEIPQAPPAEPGEQAATAAVPDHNRRVAERRREPAAAVQTAPDAPGMPATPAPQPVIDPHTAAENPAAPAAQPAQPAATTPAPAPSAAPTPPAMAAPPAVAVPPAVAAPPLAAVSPDPSAGAYDHEDTAEPGFGRRASDKVDVPPASPPQPAQAAPPQPVTPHPAAQPAAAQPGAQPPTTPPGAQPGADAPDPTAQEQAAKVEALMSGIKERIGQRINTEQTPG